MTTVPLEHGLALASILFAIGLAGLLARRNLFFMLLSVEIMLNAAGLALIAAAARWAQAEGQALFLYVLAMAAAEVAVGLALVVQVRRHTGGVRADDLRALRD